MVVMRRQKRANRGLALLQKSLRLHFTPRAAANTALGLLQLGRMEDALETLAQAVCALAEDACGFPATQQGVDRSKCDCQHWGRHAGLAAELYGHKASVLRSQNRKHEAVQCLGQSVQIIDRVRGGWVCARGRPPSSS